MTAGLLVAVAVLVMGGSRGGGLPSLTGRGGAPAGGAVRHGPVNAELLASCSAAAGLMLVVGGAAGIALAAAALLLLPGLLRRFPSRAELRRQADIRRKAPLACDLLAAALVGGCPPGRAFAVVGTAVGGPLGAELAEVGRTWRLVRTDQAMQGLLIHGHPLEGVASAILAAERSGAALRPALEASAGELRDAARADGEAAARRAAVLAVLPLGLCFLPAFLLLAVVPLVASLLTAIL